ncbi:hypothetical protein RND81_01G049100 [Saponaria officinalis]|uniref:DUF3741 domain-containing protein n=1 Tax=Saponaria officinalis TaxID=3572 RepID=A0AAW1N5S6_SAPOF
MKFNNSSSLGCFTGFLSKILCTKAHPTYPSSESETRIQFQKTVDGSATPNVVARLMGLEFMPEISSNCEKNCNSGDFRAETEDMQGKNRRVKMSFSFSETQNYFEIENDDFFVLRFDNNSQKNKKVSNFGQNKKRKCRRKQRVNRDEQGKNRVFSDEERVNLMILPHNCQIFDNDLDLSKKSSNLSQFKEKISGKNEEQGKNRVFSDTERVNLKNLPHNCQIFNTDFEFSKKSYHLSQFKENISEKNEEMSEVEVESELENCSPVSVLDDSEFISDHEVTVSSNSEEDAKSRGSECDKESQSSINEIQTEENEEKNIGLRRKYYKKHENLEMFRKICRFAEDEINNLNWKYRGMFCAQEFEEIILNFSLQIFEQLINELVDQLIEI